LRVNSTLSILVENQGRVGFGPGTLDQKGLLSKVYFTCGPKVNATITDWHHLPLPLNNTEFFLDYMEARPSLAKSTSVRSIPAFFEGQFTLDPSETPSDTFLRLDGFTKGVVIINNINIGRYWPTQGPQVTLYVPGVFLTNEKPNRILLLELEQAPQACLEGTGSDESCFVNFVDVPVINGQTPFSGKTFGSHDVMQRTWKSKL
jgi:beta-galactosidase